MFKTVKSLSYLVILVTLVIFEFWEDFVHLVLCLRFGDSEITLFRVFGDVDIWHLPFAEAFRVSFLSFFCSTFRLYIFSRLHLQKKWFLPRSGVRSLLLAFKATKKSVKWRSCLDSDKNAQQRTKMCGNKGKPFKVRFRSLYYYSTTVFPFIWSHAGKFANKLQSVKATDEWPPTDNAF